VRGGRRGRERGRGEMDGATVLLDIEWRAPKRHNPPKKRRERPKRRNKKATTKKK